MLPLDGVRVIDLSNVLAGPFCGYQLARLGAEVVKVENPDGGDLARRLGADPERARRQMGLSFVAVNAAKQSVAIDLKEPRGRDVFLDLAAQADVVLENFRPGVMDRLGLGHGVLTARNPKLVYCAISGFGQDGPWADRPAYDQIVQGLSGVMSITGDAATAPLRAGFPLSDSIGGLTAAFAIAAALVEQRRTGRGRVIDVSLLDATLATMGWAVSNCLNGGVTPHPMGNENPTAAPSGTFRTASGPLNISANEQKQFVALCGVIGRPELAGDPRFSERDARKANRAALRALVEEALCVRPAEDWEAALNRHGVPAGRVLSVPEVLAHPQIRDRAFIEDLPAGDGAKDGAEDGAEDGDAAPLRVTRPGFLLDESFVPPAAPPELGADTRNWLLRLGYGAGAIDTLIRDGVVRVPVRGCEPPTPLMERCA